jgi:hypothetical protein
MNSNDWVQDKSREIAKAIVRQWDKHDKFRAVEGEDNGEPDEVIVAKALLRVDREYGCEVMDPAGTIWDHATRVERERDKYKVVVESMRTLLFGVLENDEISEGFNNSNLDSDFKQQIRNAIAFKI